MKNKSIWFFLLMILQLKMLVACSIYKLELNQIANYSNQIIFGKVIQKQCFYNPSKTFIYTKYTIATSIVFKGNFNDTICFIEEGGVLNNTMITSTASVNFEMNDEGYFFLSFDANQKFVLSTASQSYFALNTYLQTVSNGFLNFKLPEFENQLQSITMHHSKQMVALHKSNSNINIGAQSLPLVTNISPKSITAGTQSILTISGSGFGSSNSGRVYFANPDDGGATIVSALASNIITWTDSKITLKVPAQAGTGNVCVEQLGSKAYSNQMLTITYSRSNVSYQGYNYMSNLVNQSTVGGYLINTNLNFNSNENAKNNFIKSLENWRCKSLVNFTLAGTTTVDKQENDKVNVVRFAKPTELKPGVLGITYSYFLACSDGYWYVSGFDIMFLDSTVWNYDSLATQTGKYDFMSVATHEIGHAHQLSHVIDANNLMHYSIFKDEYKRSIDTNSLACANFVLNEATKTNTCGPSSMKLLNSNICSDSYFTYYNFEKPQIAPNPANDKVTISFFLPDQSQGFVQIFDATGKLIFEPFNGMLVQGANSLEFSTIDNHFSQGVYFIKLVAANKTFVNKLVVLN